MRIEHSDLLEIVPDRLFYTFAYAMSEIFAELELTNPRMIGDVSREHEPGK